MGFSYNIGVPFSTDNPSVDQPEMLLNTVSLHDIWDVDHIGFNENNGGSHLQTTFFQEVIPIKPSDVSSVAYPAVGTADIGRPQYFYQNALTTMPLSCIRAFGSFVGGVNPTFTNQFGTVGNVVSATGNGPFVIKLVADAVAANNVIVLLTCNNFNRSVGYTFVNPTLTINTGSNLTGIIINFVVIQI